MSVIKVSKYLLRSKKDLFRCLKRTENKNNFEEERINKNVNYNAPFMCHTFD